MSNRSTLRQFFDWLNSQYQHFRAWSRSDKLALFGIFCTGLIGVAALLVALHSDEITSAQQRDHTAIDRLAAIQSSTKGAVDRLGAQITYQNRIDSINRRGASAQLTMISDEFYDFEIGGLFVLKGDTSAQNHFINRQIGLYKKCLQNRIFWEDTLLMHHLRNAYGFATTTYNVEAPVRLTTLGRGELTRLLVGNDLKSA